MEHFVVSARKYRPQTFKDVVGQSAITNTLLNAIENNHLAQALLFTGPRGVGKTTCARILAKMINSDGTETEEEDFAFNIFELDAASNNSVDDIRNLTDQVRIPPQVGKYKVYIIDEVHMLSQAAFNAFLKTLEEPPKHCIFILATTEKHKIIPTILSRCQIFDFKRISVRDAKDYLKYIAEEQGISAEDDALHIIAQKADGAMRDALSIFDRVVSFSGKNLTRQAVTENLNVLDYETYFESTNLILDNNIPELLIQFNATLAKGFDGHHYIAGLASHFRDLLVCKNPETLSLLEVGEDTTQKYMDQSKRASQEFLLKGIELANDCDLKYKNSKNQRLLVELCLMQLASITFDGEKKNSSRFIIPASYFKAKGITPIPVQKEKPNQQATIPEPQQQPKQEEPVTSVKEEAVTTYEPPKPKIALKRDATTTSGLSLKSIRAKKEHQIRQMEVVIDENDLPREAFTEEEFISVWNDYIKTLHTKGEKIMASILEMDTPKLNETSIELEFPNETLKLELEKAQYPLMEYMRRTLKNYDLKLEISVNEEVAKQYVFTAKDKFEKLKEKNPNIELLKTTFGLDL
ncbi:DNA polymerase III subunit gamma/tau [Meridianimaribacter flavus]|uniref:DNA polymerase III subunit gamma/tau n=1 Tax=Meridianimaribacter flavus TaxID=571115 RepID=A0ABY2G287_9FLAO|nr:DNA polymerase III subunit gamma/tau [Meridianimaribacter flavus]TDY05812.1 DNA polymerase-3 subunit gamma/tau [Meridianimaribacter flavus]